MRAAAYVRVSTTKQADEGLSLVRQQEVVRAEADAKGWRLDAADIFVESGVSGTKDDRPELGRLLDRLDDFDALLTPKLDRLGRSAGFVLTLTERLKAADVAFVSVLDRIDATNPSGKAQLGMLAVFAEFESAIIGERVKEVTTARVAGGKHHGRAPYGYVSDNGALVVVDDQASVVRRIFRMADEGLSQRLIARTLNGDGIDSRTGSGWTQAAIGKVLQNRTYTGVNVLHRLEYDGDHEPIVPAELFERLALDRARQSKTKARGTGRPVEGQHLLTHGLLRCGHCTAAMLPRKAGDSYKCSGRDKNGLDSCPQVPITRKIIDTAIFEQFEARALDLKGMSAQIAARANERLEDQAAIVAGARKAAKAAATNHDRVRGYMQSGRLDLDDWQEQRPGLIAERERTAAALVEAEQVHAALKAASSSAADSASEALQSVLSVRESITGTVADAKGLEGARLALARIFDAIYVRRKDPNDPNIPDKLLDGERELIAVHQEDADGVVTGLDRVTAERWELTLVPRAEALTGLDADWRPLFVGQTLTHNANDGLAR